MSLSGIVDGRLSVNALDRGQLVAAEQVTVRLLHGERVAMRSDPLPTAASADP